MIAPLTFRKTAEKESRYDFQTETRSVPYRVSGVKVNFLGELIHESYS